MRRDEIRLTEDISQQKVTPARQLRLSRHDRDVREHIKTPWIPVSLRVKTDWEFEIDSQQLPS